MSEPEAQPFDAMPVAQFPDDFQLRLGPVMAEFAQRYGPIFRRRTPPQMQPEFGDWLVYMVGPEANRFVMHTHRQAFSHDRGWSPQLFPVLEKGLLNTDDPAHAHQRRMMNPAFAAAYMARYVPLMDGIIARHAARWTTQAQVEMADATRALAFDVAAEALVGLDHGPEVDRLRELFYQLFRNDITSEAEFMAFVTRVRAEQDAIILDIIQRRRRAPTDDIMGMLVTATDEAGRGFSDTELLGQVQILLVAGHETTTTLSAWLLYVLATQPEWLARVRGEVVAVAPSGPITYDGVRALALTGRVIDETGRLYSPVGFVPRGVVAPFAFGGYQVPAGTQLRLSLVGSHRLPRIFAEPDRFDPDRFAPPREEDKRAPYALVTFGGGPRICIGINFAQIEVKALAARVVRDYDLAVPAGSPAPQQAYFGVVATPVPGMPLAVRPRAR